MKISFANSPNFCRKLKPSEEGEYCDVLKRGKALVSGEGKNMLIIPASSLPQSKSNNTGVGNLDGEDEKKFFEFVKKYWGINEVQLLPVGQYHIHNNQYSIYSGTSMDFGNHVINPKSFLLESDFNDLVKSNKDNSKVNFGNVVLKESKQELLLKSLYKCMPEYLRSQFEAYKNNNQPRLEKKALYRALREINGHYNYKKWNQTDANLFDERVVNLKNREKRIAEIKKIKPETIDFYYFKQFLAEKSLSHAKKELNNKGIKLAGDMLCGFSFDEVWSNPKAFIKDSTIGWGLPALNLESDAAEKLLREKVNFYAKNFDGFRVDAAWSYVSPIVKNYNTNDTFQKKYGDKYLKIIEDETKNVKGQNFDLKNITYEFAADGDKFHLYQGKELSPLVKDRVKIYTSSYLKDNWGSSDAFYRRNWGDNYILGVQNHDSSPIKQTETQVSALSKILKIPEEKLQDRNNFLKAKFAEPLGAKNFMLFFMSALGMKGQFKDNSDVLLNYTSKVPANYEEFYMNSLQSGEAFNPMDALEKQFKAKGLDKKDKKLYKKIVKYRKILEQKEGQNNLSKKVAISLACCSALILGIYEVYSYLVKSKINHPPHLQDMFYNHQ